MSNPAWPHGPLDRCHIVQSHPAGRNKKSLPAIIDHKAQPNPGPHDCSPTCIVLNRDTLALDYRFDYYMYGQFMKFIRPGAMRIHSDLPSEALPNIAVRNSDGAIVLVVANLKDRPAQFAVAWGDRHLTATLDGESVATFRGPSRWHRANEDRLRPESF